MINIIQEINNLELLKEWKFSSICILYWSLYQKVLLLDTMVAVLQVTAIEDLVFMFSYFPNKEIEYFNDCLQPIQKVYRSIV